MRLALAILAASVALAVVVAFLPRVEDAGRYEFQQFRDYDGHIVRDPDPILLAGGLAIPLVAPGKHGAGDLFPPGQLFAARFRAERVERGRDAMLVLDPSSLRLQPASSGLAIPDWRDLGAITLHGEIADSKCYLGVMNPGLGRVHRACAIRCLSGGVPPIFVARDRQGQKQVLWLAGPAGEPVGKDLLDFAAQPVTASGRLYSLGTLRYFRLDLRSLHRE